MKRHSSKIFIAIMLLFLSGAVLMPHVAFAENIIERIATSGINNAIANIAYYFLSFTALLVSFTGSFLSISINLTTHIGGIYETLPAIKSVWITIRDISSMFIIFSLLFYSIRTILGIGENNLNRLIINIFIAGLLINFSLFFVRVAVDASNIISLQFYNAIAPNTSQNWTVGQVFQDGGLSNVFMQSLAIPKIYANSNVTKSVDVAAGIGFATLGGILVMITASMSFLAAAVAFTARTGILLFIMATSPLYFAGMIFPQIKKAVSDKMLNYLKAQLIFMPVYLLLLYIALKIISDPNFMSIFNQSATGSLSNNAFGPVWIGVLVQYTIAMLFINAPLVAAISLGGVGMKWAPNAKDISSRVGGFFGRTFVARPTRKVGKYFDEAASKTQGFGGKWGGRLYTATGLRKIGQGTRHLLKAGEEAKYGAPQNLAGYSKEDKERTKFVAGVARHDKQEATINSILYRKGSTTATDEEMKKFRSTVSGMDVKEMQEMDMDELEKPDFISAVPTGKFDSLLKEMSPDQQQKLKDAREKAFIKIVEDRTKGVDYLFNSVLKGKAPEIAKLPTEILTKPEVAKKLDAASLRKMIDEGVGREAREKIREIIEGYHTSLSISGTTPTPIFQKAYEYLQSPAGGIF